MLETAAGGQLVIDTKYKDVLPSDHGVDDEDVTLVADRRRIKVTRADIYQVVAYTAHDKWRGATGALLYPVVLAEGDTLPRPMQIRGFGPQCGCSSWTSASRRRATCRPSWTRCASWPTDPRRGPS